MREKSAVWKGGRYVEPGRYVRLSLPGGRSKLEHRAVMEQHLGRPLLRTEIVHHIDGNKTNNAIENLALMTMADHVRLHMPRKGTGTRS